MLCFGRKVLQFCILPFVIYSSLSSLYSTVSQYLPSITDPKLRVHSAFWSRTRVHFDFRPLYWGTHFGLTLNFLKVSHYNRFSIRLSGHFVLSRGVLVWVHICPLITYSVHFDLSHPLSCVIYHVRVNELVYFLI